MFLRPKGCPSEPNIAKLYSLRNVLLTSSIKSQGLDQRRCSQTPRRSTSSCFSLLGMSAPGTLRNFVVHSEERKTFERAQHERPKKENKGTKTQNETQRGAVYGSWLPASSGRGGSIHVRSACCRLSPERDGSPRRASFTFLPAHAEKQKPQPRLRTSLKLAPRNLPVPCSESSPEATRRRQDRAMRRVCAGSAVAPGPAKETQSQKDEATRATMRRRDRRGVWPRAARPPGRHPTVWLWRLRFAPR